MKKLLLFTAFTFLFSNINIAQGLSFGAKLGVNFASISNSDSETKGRTSFHLGAVAEYAITDKFSGQAEILYSGMGAKTEYSDDEESFEGKTKLSYISLPLLGKYYVTEDLSIEGGPQFSFLISANEEYTSTYEDFNGDTETESGTEDIKKGLSGFDFGFGIGGTYKLENGIFFSLRYVLGLSKLAASGDGKNKNNVFQISGGYKFN
jgi:long-subunit fatty acid transport protein